MASSVEIIAVGTEITRGAVAERNSEYLARSLAAAGHPPSRIVLLSDNVELVARELGSAMQRGAVVIVTGGLGPTVDDVTKEAAIRALGGETETRPEITSLVRARFAEHGVPMPEAYLDQARIPAGASVLPNGIGAAVGLRVRRGSFDLFLLPGPPEEMRAMFTRSVLPELPQPGGEAVVRIRTFGLSETEAEERVRAALPADTMKRLSITATPAGIDLYLPAPPGSGAEAVRAAFGSLCYGSGEQSMEEVVVALLRRETRTLATAESVTGGLLASMIVSVSGASDVFREGFVAYGNEAKSLRLGVGADLITRYGAVSEEVCVAMARGARVRAATDFALATTGIAGPGGGSARKPVGCVFVSLDSGRRLFCRRLRLAGPRETVRRRAAYHALDLLRLVLLADEERLEPHAVKGDLERGRS